MQNPYISGNPVTEESFINRQRELRRVVSRILNHGQSSAIIGEPRSGKTSLLYYLKATENQEALYGTEKEKLLFSYVDSLALGSRFTPTTFWQFVLKPIEATLGKGITDLSEAYRTCMDEACGNFVLERLFAQLFLSGKRLVLLLDEFDAFLENDIFHQSEFYGGLRTLASRSKGLVIVLASRQSLSQLNHGTQEFNRTGSPYFNFLNEIHLRPFSQKAIAQILALAGGRFSNDDRAFIRRLAGGHPYFLQALSSEVWEIYDDGEVEDSEERYKLAREEFYATAKNTLGDIWRLWSPEMRKAFVTVALDEMPLMLDATNTKFNILGLLESLPTYAPELAELKRRGFIKEDAKLDSGYCVTAKIMLKFIADELLKALRKAQGGKKELGTHFYEAEWDGLFTVGEKKEYAQAAKNLYGIFKEGIDIFGKLSQ